MVTIFQIFKTKKQKNTKKNPNTNFLPIFYIVGTKSKEKKLKYSNTKFIRTLVCFKKPKHIRIAKDFPVC